jgi:hypothetical protein
MMSVYYFLDSWRATTNRRFVASVTVSHIVDHSIPHAHACGRSSSSSEYTNHSKLEACSRSITAFTPESYPWVLVIEFSSQND